VPLGQAFPKLQYVDLAERKEAMPLHHEAIIAACMCAQVSDRSLKVSSK